MNAIIKEMAKVLILVLCCCWACGQGFCEDLELLINSTKVGSRVEIGIHNRCDHDLRIWDADDGLGWGTWTIMFYDLNWLTVFARNPEAAFTVTGIRSVLLPSGGSARVVLNLDDGTWIPHKIPIFPSVREKVVAILAKENLNRDTPKSDLFWSGLVTSSASKKPKE